MKKFDSINVIPFVDILLVLLAIVLMTSTFIAKGIIPVDLPKSASEQKMESRNVVITIYEDGKLFLEKEPTTLERLHVHLETLTQETHFSINCDKKAPFEFFVQVLEALTSRHFRNIDIVTVK